MQNSKGILFADGDAQIRAQAADVLDAAGFRVLTAETGSLAFEILNRLQMDLAVVDVHLPGPLDGLEVCRRICHQFDLPTIALVWEDCPEEMLAAYRAGAIDCVVKPVRWDELLGRVQLVLVREAGRIAQQPRILRNGRLALDLGARVMHLGGNAIPLSPIEFRMLRYFMERPGEVVRKDDLLHHVWGYQVATGDLNLVDSAIRRLRKLIEPDPGEPTCLVTVWGIGYRFDCPL